MGRGDSEPSGPHLSPCSMETFTLGSPLRWVHISQEGAVDTSTRSGSLKNMNELI